MLGLTVVIAVINDSIVSLQSKTQNVDLTLTTAFSTCARNEFKISNLSNDKVVLNDTTTGYNYFDNRSSLRRGWKRPGRLQFSLRGNG